ncbi:MAG: large conductance mechanosensitive channel protein MscL [Coriobacteriia bacterium]|nr:large conductance mechanosensitive channel protein MscL [Coriobacteriia bacterium]
MFQEFRDFALKGNAIVLAVGVVMGVAFNAIVTSVVEGILNPLIGVLLGGINLNEQMVTIAGVTFAWGSVVGAVINFLAVAVALFVVVKFIARLNREPDPTTHACPYCTTEISNDATRCPACTSELVPV